MIDLVLAANDVEVLRRELTGGDVEKCAVLFANYTVRLDGTYRLLVHRLHFPTSDDYTRYGPLEAELKPAYVSHVTKQARLAKCAIVFVHSHPGTHAPVFSSVDWDGEQHLAAFLARRHPGFPHAALVISKGGMQARRIGTNDYIRVLALGDNREVLFEPTQSQETVADLFDRQIRAFGAEGQRSLQALRIAIVGLGGMGSLVAQQLAHLGVRDFILIDPDVLENTNLNRVVNAMPQSVGSPKVDVAADSIRQIAPTAQVTTIKDDVTRVNVAKELLNADLIYGCTDSHGSRAILQQVAYQYLIPCIDTGVTITVADGRITHIYGRVQLLAPGHPCLTCSGLLDSSEVRRDMMTPFERQADPYIQGAREPAPAVMSLNGTIASLAVTMLLSVVCGMPVAARYLLYNALSSLLRNVRGQSDPNCYICSRSGAFARGDTWPLHGRQD